MESFNTKFFSHYISLVNMMAWVPIFFLFFNESLSLSEVILLESIYYFSVVLLEVPSGYFSDLVGRKKTLVLSTLAFAISYLLFGFMPSEFYVLAIAQFFLACGISFLSGTDTAFYYESLKAQNLESEYENREAQIQKTKRYASAFAALAGGFGGYFSLRYGYVFSFLFTIPALWIVFRFKEVNSEETASGFLIQLKKLKHYLSLANLRWLFAFSVINYILVHIPYEFYQPYLSLLENKNTLFTIDDAIYSGIIIAITRFIGGFIAGKSMHITRKWGMKSTALIALALQLLLILALGSVLHPVVVILLMGRSASLALTAAPVNVLINRQINKAQRATYFSFQSLISRLGYAIVLVALSSSISSTIKNDWSSLSQIFMLSFVGGCTISIFLLFLKTGDLTFKTDPNS